jgi:D-aspartate ligase
MDQGVAAPRSGAEGGVFGPVPYRVVLACGGLSLLRCFTGLAVPIVIADSDPESLTLHSRYARNRRMIASATREPAQAVKDLVAIGKTFTERPMLAFDNESMLLLVSRYRDVLSRYYRFLLPDAELIEDVCCKLRFAMLAQRLDLPVPRSIVPGPDTDIDEIARQIGLPCVLKPTSHTGRFHREVLQHEHAHAYKVLRADTLEDLRLKFGRMRTYCDAFVIQEYIPGGDDCLYSFHAYLDQKSSPLGFFVGRKIRTCPRDSGFSSYLELVHEPEIAWLGLSALRKMNLVGPVKLDFKKDPVHNRYYLLECNARFTLWNYLGAASGINLPRLALASLHEEPVAMVTGYRTDIRWFSFGIDFRAFLREYHPDGDWTWLQWLWSLNSRKVYDVFSWRDPWPWIVCASRYLEANWRKVTRLLARLFARRQPAPTAPAPVAPAASAVVMERKSA